MSGKTKPWRSFSVLLAKNSRVHGSWRKQSALVVVVGNHRFRHRSTTSRSSRFTPSLILFRHVVRRDGLPLWSMSIVSTLSWWAADTASKHPYSQEWLSNLGCHYAADVFLPGGDRRGRRSAPSGDSNRVRIELLERSQKLERRSSASASASNSGSGGIFTTDLDSIWWLWALPLIRCETISRRRRCEGQGKWGRLPTCCTMP